MNLPERAIQAFDRALSYKPDYVDAIYNRGNALLFARRLDEALATFERVIQMKPLYALAYNGRGLTCLELKRFDEAMADFDHVLRLKPDFRRRWPIAPARWRRLAISTVHSSTMARRAPSPPIWKPLCSATPGC